jgi:hypothetical protein
MKISNITSPQGELRVQMAPSQQQYSAAYMIHSNRGTCYPMRIAYTVTQKMGLCVRIQKFLVSVLILKLDFTAGKMPHPPV